MMAARHPEGETPDLQPLLRAGGLGLRRSHPHHPNGGTGSTRSGRWPRRSGTSSPAASRPGNLRLPSRLPAAMAYVEEVFPDFGIPYGLLAGDGAHRVPALSGRSSLSSPSRSTAIAVEDVNRPGSNSPYINRGQFLLKPIVDVLSAKARITGRRRLLGRADSQSSPEGLKQISRTPGTLEGVRRLLGRRSTVIAGVAGGASGASFADLATLGGAKTGSRGHHCRRTGRSLTGDGLPR